MNRKKTGLSICFTVLLYVAFLILQIFVISRKANYFVDETLSYGLANYTKGYFISLQEGYRYEPAADPFIEYLSCQPGNRSNLQIAWSNQTNDSHPPFYYALVHIVGALKVGTFSKWYAGAINIVFALLSLFMIRRLSEQFTKNDMIRDLISVGFIFNYCILSDISLFRMYIMSMFLVLTTTYMIVLQIKKNRGILFYLVMIIIVYIGALSHYYCLLYDILLSVVYCVYLLFQKKWKDVVFYCLSMGIAAAATIFTFPAIVRHLFFTGHAKDAYTGLTSVSDYLSRVFLCFNTINDALFGKMLYLIIPLLLISLFIRKKKDTEKTYLFVLLPAFLYFIIIAITASYTNERYFTPIFGILFCGVFCLFYSRLEDYLRSKKAFYIICAALMLLTTVISYYKADWPYLYRDDLEYLNKADEHRDADCICIHNEYRLGWEVQLNFNEFIKYKSFMILDQNEITPEDLTKFIDKDPVVIHLTCIDDKEDYISQIINALPQFSAYETIGGNGNGVSYYLY